jgi:very-short-patch-repair endonuclease
MRKQVFNATSMNNRRLDLRKRATQAEKILWERLRRHSLGVRFFRQYSIEGYVVDFYCPEKRLAIEIEGGIHNLVNQRIYDIYRKKLIQAYNINFLLFTNNDLYLYAEKTVETIKVRISTPSKIKRGQGEL